MLFTTMEFLLVFFPLVTVVYFLLPQRCKNAWLLIVSLLFYAWGEPRFVFVMLCSIVINYLFARGVECARRGIKKWVLAAAVVMNLGVLFVYKYMNFAIETLHQLAPQTQTLFGRTRFVLPIGISFFTFQALSYVIDVYRGVPAQKNILNIGLYISLFPQLIAGPIVRYTTIMEQLKQRRTTPQLFANGLRRFLIGFNKKVLLANIMALVVDQAFGASQLSVSMAWLGAISYALQIYFDFCGYSEMAIGLGQIYGFNFLENFDYPYISKTITEFWRRWHISLGTWFRDYVYFPLGGSRVRSRLRLALNLTVVWLATGVWHGASWNFILWGILYGFLIIIEKLTDLPRRLPHHKGAALVYRCYILMMVLFGWVLFRAENLPKAAQYLSTMFGLNGAALVDATFVAYFRDYVVMITAGMICATPLMKNYRNKLLAKHAGYTTAIENAALFVQIILFLFSVSFLAMNAHNPFIYFNF